MLRLLVVGQIVAHDAAHVEVVAQLERQHRVVYLARAYAFDIFLGSHLVGILVIVWYSSAEHDSLEIEFFAEFLAILVHASCQTQSAVVGMYEHFDAIEYVALGVVGVEGFVASHLRVGVVALHHIIINNNRQRASHYLVVDDYHHLSLGEYCDEFLDLSFCPEHVFVAIDALE